MQYVLTTGVTVVAAEVPVSKSHTNSNEQAISMDISMCGYQTWVTLWIYPWIFDIGI